MIVMRGERSTGDFFLNSDCDVGVSGRLSASLDWAGSPHFPPMAHWALGDLVPTPTHTAGGIRWLRCLACRLTHASGIFPRVGGWSDALVAPAATSGSFRTLRLSPLRRPSRFELILGFGGDTLTNLFPPDIPELFAAFVRPVPTIFGATITSFELVATMVLFT